MKKIATLCEFDDFPQVSLAIYKGGSTYHVLQIYKSAKSRDAYDGMINLCTNHMTYLSSKDLVDALEEGAHKHKKSKQFKLSICRMRETVTGTEDESATTEQHLLAIANAVCEKKLVHDDCRIELDRAAGAIRIAVKNKNFTVPSYCWVLPDFSSPSKMIKFVKKYDGRVTGPNNSDEYCEE